MSGETDLQTLLMTMSPRLSETVYAFATVQGSNIPSGLNAIGTFIEDEGLSIIAPFHEIDGKEMLHSGRWAKISLEVHSSLSAAGLTARIATALADQGISANVVAAYHHDHVFVPWDQRHTALAALEALASLEA